MVHSAECAAQLTTAGDGGPFAGLGLKPLFPPEMRGVMPLADAARRLDVRRGKRPAALPPAHGASPRLSGQTLARRQTSIAARAAR